MTSLFRLITINLLRKIYAERAVPAIALLAVTPGWIQKGLWMHGLGYIGIVRNLLSVRLVLFCGAFVVTAQFNGRWGYLSCGGEV